MDPLIKEIFAFAIPLMSLGAGAFYYFSTRKHLETKEARQAREKTEAAEKEKHEALHKAHEAAITHLTSCNDGNEKQLKLLAQLHTEALLRQDTQLATFLSYAKEQSTLHVEVAKLVERDLARGRTVDSIDDNVKSLTALVTNHIIARGNGK